MDVQCWVRNLCPMIQLNERHDIRICVGIFDVNDQRLD